MSARLNLEKIPYISWKGKTFSQISANIQKNTVNSKSAPILTSRLIQNPQPLKIYRNEIASVALKNCGSRHASKMFHFETPGNIINNSKIVNTKANGLVNTHDITLPNNQGEYPGSSCDTYLNPQNPNLTNRCISTQNNALKRVRSSGIIRKKFDSSRSNGNSTYCTDTNQYLESRNRTYEQNTYHLLRKGDSGNVPGSAASSQNVYASNTVANCKGTDIDALTTAYVPVYYKPSNSRFAEQGAVTSSTRLLRLKYDTITDGGAKLKSSFGKETANALAYSTTNSNIYSLKQKIGYPNRKTPDFNPVTGELRNCTEDACNIKKHPI